ncbi:MAG: hypothetical protein JNL38_27825, partial [Myxococcales bacterium]|nr:hypothetical protein [Myxococcales bacterium]
AAVEALSHYAAEVRSGAFPAAEHTYKANGPSASGAPKVAEDPALDAPLALDLWH